MALESASATTNALGQKLAPKLHILWNRQAVVASMLEAEAGWGQNCAWDVESGTSTAADTVVEGADLAAGEMTSDTDDAAKLGWADYRTGFNVTQRALDAAASSGGITAEMLTDLFGQRAMAKAAALVSKINKDIYAGTGTSGGSGAPNIVGLFGGATDASGTYATLARGTYADFAGYVSANGGTPRALTTNLLSLAEQNVFVNCGEAPTHILCSPGVYRKYESLFENVMRTDNDGRGALRTYNTGASALFYKGIPLVRDKDCPAGKLIFANMNYVKMRFLPRAGQTKDAVYSEMRTLTGRGNEQPLTATTIPFRIELLGKTGTAYKAMLYTTVQLMVLKPNAFAQVIDIDET